MAVKLTQYLRQCDVDPNIRVVIITGAGDSFCVGLDLNDIRQRDQENKPADINEHPTQRVLRTYPFQISKPVICAINGAEKFPFGSCHGACTCQQSNTLC